MSIKSKLYGENIIQNLQYLGRHKWKIPEFIICNIIILEYIQRAFLL